MLHQDNWAPLRESKLHPDILVPERRVFKDELLHHLYATDILEYLYDHTSTLQQLLLTHKSYVFADNNAGNAIEQDCP